jgi:integrase
VDGRIAEALAEREAGTNPLGLMFPSPRGKHWRSSNFARRVLLPAYQAVGWREATADAARKDTDGQRWTWHSLRHVFCTTALFTWNIEPADVSRLAGHANIRTTLDMYVGTTAGMLERARAATEV